MFNNDDDKEEVTQNINSMFGNANDNNDNKKDNEDGGSLFGNSKKK